LRIPDQAFVTEGTKGTKLTKTNEEEGKILGNEETKVERQLRRPAVR
jgi:hypothetical protein